MYIPNISTIVGVCKVEEVLDNFVIRPEVDLQDLLSLAGLKHPFGIFIFCLRTQRRHFFLAIAFNEVLPKLGRSVRPTVRKNTFLFVPTPGPVMR
jgi:hypothetical protein